MDQDYKVTLGDNWKGSDIELLERAAINFDNLSIVEKIRVASFKSRIYDDINSDILSILMDLAIAQQKNPKN